MGTIALSVGVTALFVVFRSAELSIEEIHNLVDDLIEAHGDYLPESFKDKRPVLA